MSGAVPDRCGPLYDPACDSGGPRTPSPPPPAGDTAQLFAALSKLDLVRQNLDWTTHLGLLYEKDQITQENARLKSICDVLEADLAKAKALQKSLREEYTLLYDTSLQFRERMVYYLVQFYKLSDASQCLEQDEYHQRAFAAAQESRRRDIECARRQLTKGHSRGDFIPFYARVHAYDATFSGQGHDAQTTNGSS